MRQGLRQELVASRPNPDGSGRFERFGWIYQRDDGSMLVQYHQGPTGECSSTTMPPAFIPGTHVVGMYHTHPSLSGEIYLTPGCVKKGKADPFSNGGGSDEDWKVPDNPNYGNNPMYIISAAGIISRLTPGWPKNNRPANPHRWRFNPSNPQSCLTTYVP